MPKYNYDRYRILEPTDMSGYLRELPQNPEMSSHLAFLYLYGARRGEPLTMTLDNFWEDQTHLWCKVPTLKTKGQPWRNLKLPKTAPFMTYLRQYLGGLRTWMKHRVPEDLQDLAIKTERYMPWPHSYGWYYSKMKELDQDISAYAFRHTRAFRMAEAGATVMELVDWFGWSSPKPAMWYISASGVLAQGLADRIQVI